jgi:hypothetical protein
MHDSNGYSFYPKDDEIPVSVVFGNSIAGTAPTSVQTVPSPTTIIEGKKALNTISIGRITDWVGNVLALAILEYRSGIM